MAVSYTGKNTLPKVSIIIVTYNAAAYLQKCLESVYRQTYPFLHIIVIDGASTDGTVDILKKNAGSIDYWQSGPDEGIYYAMNKGLQYISGKWVYFLGADDELYDDFSAMLYQLEDNKAIYYGRVTINGQKTPGPVSAYKHAKDTICHQAIIYPAAVFKKYRYNTKYPITADHLLNAQCWKDKDLYFRFIDLTIAKFNHTGASSTKIDTLFKKDQPKIILKNYGPVVWARYMFRLFKMRVTPANYQPGNKAKK
jgi:glycosyltransferase involved in cell wall biosynthesis